jgi:hypothetical protein
MTPMDTYLEQAKQFALQDAQGKLYEQAGQTWGDHIWPWLQPLLEQALQALG